MRKLDINNRRYLGSKYKLLNFIDEVVKKNCKNVKSVIDVFGGTGVVAKYFYNQGKEIYVNDILKSNYNAYISWFGQAEVEVDKLIKIINEYNEKSITNENYFSKNFANTYFSKKDCIKIGYIRANIEKLHADKEINDRERAILVTSLIYSMDKIANTVGHYDAYRKSSNIQDKFEMYMIDVDNKQKSKTNIFNMDANELVRNIKADLIYIDPPYNSRQYGDAYHLLENIANWEKPEVFGVAKKMDRSNIKSDYCTNKAVKAFEDLIDNCNVRYILIAYNNTGNKSNDRSNAKISDLQIKEILEKKGKVTIFEQEYNNFTTGKSKADNHKERIFLCEVNKKFKESSIRIDNKSSFAKSPLNYTGGKYKLLPQLDLKFPKEIDTFVDFFCGGANVSVNINAKNIIAIDKETNLIRVLNLFKDYKYIDIIKKIECIIEKYDLSNSYNNSYTYYNCDSSSGLGKYNKDGYLKLREDYNSMEVSIDKDFMFLTLIIYGFNNQIRFNSNGKFNMPVGKRDFNNSIRKNILSFCEKLECNNISFKNMDYKKFNVSNLSKKDFCYFDPPYFLGTASYNELDLWNENNEKELLEFIHSLSQKNIKFALSNVIEHKGKKHDMLIEWAINNKFNINYLDFDYSNANYQIKDKTQKTVEVLITNYNN